MNANKVLNTKNWQKSFISNNILDGIHMAFKGWHYKIISFLDNVFWENLFMNKLWIKNLFQGFCPMQVLYIYLKIYIIAAFWELLETLS